MWQTVFHYISLAPTHQTLENQMPSGSGSMFKYRGGMRSPNRTNPKRARPEKMSRKKSIFK